MRIDTTWGTLAAAVATTLVVAIALMALTACVVSPSREAQSVLSDDIGITQQVKSRFMDSPQVDGRTIHVETLHRTVLLTGVASTPLEKSIASEIALGISGVRLVQNEITIRQ